MFRKPRLVLIAAAGAMVLALLVAHASPVRAYILRRVVETLRSSYGIDLRASSLSYNLLTLSAELRDVQVAASATPTEPLATAARLGLSFGPRTLLGDISVKRVSIVSPRIDIRRHSDGTDNVPRVTSASSRGERLVLPPIRVDDLTIAFQQPSASAVIRRAAFELTSSEAGRISASIKAADKVTLTAGDRAIDLDDLAATIEVEDERLNLIEFTASRPGTRVHASGRVALQGDASTIDLTVKASSLIESWWAEFRDEAGPAGQMDAIARVTGSLAEPTIAVETVSKSLAWSGLQASAIEARGTYSRGQLSLKTITLAIAGGTVKADGEIVVDDKSRPSRMEVRWTNVDAAQIPGAEDLAAMIAKDGTASIQWRTDAAAASPRIEVTAATGVRASGKHVPIVVRGSGQGDRWHVEVGPRDTRAMPVTATADIGLDSRRWQASSIDGRVVLRAADLPGAIRQAQDFGLPVGFDPATAAGTVDVDATVDGTLGAIRTTGRMNGHAVTVAGLPTLDLEATFNVDVAGKTSTGTFRLQAPGLESSTLVAQHDLSLGGSLVSSGTWSGPLNDPAVDASFSGRNLTISRGGSVPIAATGGTFDGVLKGPATRLDGGAKLTIASVDIDGRAAGAVTANLTVSDGIVRVQARAPDVKTVMEGTVDVERPNRFDGRATVTDYDIDALLALTGLAGLEPGAVHGRVSSAIGFKGDLQNPSAATVTLNVAPIDANVFDVPITMGEGLRATVTEGNVDVENVTITLGGVALRLGGRVATDRSGGKLLLDVDGEVGGLTPWFTRLSGSADVIAVGRVSGRIVAETSPDGLATSGTIDATLSSLSKGNRIVARDVRAAIVLDGQRAEVKAATGTVFGGRLSAAGGAPLVWLNQWLPGRFKVARPPIDQPATLEGKASFDVPALFDLLGREPMEVLRGGIELSANLSAAEPTLASLVGELRLERGELSANDLKYEQSGVSRFRVSGGALTVEAFDWRGPGSTVIGRGRLGLIEGIETDLRLDVDTELGIVGALLSGRATGRVEGNIAVHRGSGALRVTSDATLRDASWLIPGVRILFAGWSGHIRLEDRALTVSNLTGAVNGGSIRVDGQLPLESSAAGGGLTIVASDILIDVPRGLHTQLGADLVWQRAEPAPRLQGKVEITANRYTEPVTRILQLVNSMASATRRSSDSTLPAWLANTALDIHFAVSDPILIDNSVGTVELMPDLRLGGTIDAPSLSGGVDVVDDGRIRIGGRTYRLRDSEVRFAPASGLVPTLDAVGDTRIGDYDVTIRISGTPDRIETSFTSIPPLGERELQSLIVTGQTGEQTTPGSRQSDDDNFAAAAAATDILGFAGRFVGFDSVRIGASDLDLVSKDVNAAQHLTVSKSLGSRFDLIFSDNLEDGSVTWVLVWKPTPVNEIRASSVEDGTRTLEFRRSLVFGPGTPSGTRADRRVAEQSRPIVEAVRITGTPGFSEAEVSRKLELDAGNRFEVRRWIEDRHRLEDFYLDRGYHRVRIAPTRIETADRSRVSLAYDIERGPQTVIEVTGDKLPGEVVAQMYEAWRGLPIADVVRTEFERIARDGLAREGYYRPSLKLDFAAETRDLARVTMQVGRGPQTKRLMVAWTGNRDVSIADLDALVAPHVAESEAWLDSESIAWQVRQLYASRGHLQAQVTVSEPVFRDPDATLPIAIDEGVLSRVADVRLEGVDPSRMPGAVEALGLSTGAPFAASAPVEAARRLRAFYASLGYRRADVTHKATTAKDGSVSMTWHVTEGPRYLVKDVNVVGAETTREGMVQKAITLQPGDTMSQNDIDTTRRNLYGIGTFRRVDFDFGDSTFPPGSSTRELPVTLTIQAEEPQRFQLKYGVQFSFDRSTGRGGGTALGGSVELRDQNFLGRALQASVGAHWDPELQTVAVLVSAPRFLGKAVRTNVYVRDRREQELLESSSSFDGATLDDQRREATFEQRWRPASALELVWGYHVSSRRFLLTHDAEQIDVGGLLAGPLFSVIVDKRDSPFDAKRGLFHSSSFQFGAESLGSELGYVRYLVRQSYYQPLGKLTAAGSVRYGTIRKFSGTVPASVIDLFFEAGGTNSVRGYPEDSLSAITVADFALGGTNLLVLNGELRFPITKRLGGAAFVDAGNTFASSSDVKLGRLALGAGLGLRIQTPLAPFRLDFAHPFSEEYGRHGIRVHFSIGQIF